MKKILNTSLCIVLYSTSFCQNPTNNLYASNAIAIEENILEHTTVYSAEKSDGLCFIHENKEHLGTNGYFGWYKVIIADTCQFSFVITPENCNTQIDFVVYKYYDNFFLDDFNHFVRYYPERQNFWKNDSTNFTTGLSNEYKLCHVGVTKSPQMNPFCKSINAKAGDIYYIAIQINKPAYFKIAVNAKIGKFPKVSTLKNVTFESNKTVLQKTSYAELDKLVKQLQEKPAMQIEISGHTDNVGNEADNKTLSTGRAKAVYDYLISKGIAATRLTYKGYGSSKPIASNTTETGKQQNRRVEFMIITK